MANSLLTINMITREAVRLWKNSNEFIQHIDQQYDDSFAKTGAKIGTSLRIRLPNDFTVRTGPAASVQDTAEQSTTLVLATQKGIDVSYSSTDRTMSLDDFSRRVLAPMVNNLCGAVAADVMSGVDGGVSNYTSNVTGAGAVTTPTAQTWLQAGAILDLKSAPRGRRKLILDPLTMARTVASLAGLFNPQRTIGEQYSSGQMQEALGFDWYMDQTVRKHVNGAFTAGTVNGALQSGLSVITNALTQNLALGDIITFASVNSVNRITKVSDATLAQFVVTAPAANGALAVSIYPALVPPVGGQAVQYQTVDSSPVNGAAINLANNSAVVSETWRKNIAFAPEAVTLATADLELPKGVHEAAREAFDGVAMRMISAYNITTDQFITRLDVLYGYEWVRPEWAVAVADAI
jgi:hypothetical protein